MKFNKIIQHLLIVLILLPQTLPAQDNRTVKTKVADILALLPAEDAAQANRLFQELMTLDDDGLTILTDGVLPNKDAAGTASVHAIDLLTHYVTTKEHKTRLEQLYINALNEADDVEVKGYFINHLKLIGSDNAVNTLTQYLEDKALYDLAVSALVSIGTQNARQALTSALSKGTPALQKRLIKALGDLQHQPALSSITPFVSNDNIPVRKQALWSIALIADPASADILIQQAKNSGFRHEETEATEALIEYMHQMDRKNNTAVVERLSKAILDNTPEASQQHFRLAALKSFAKVNAEAAVSLLIKERKRFDAEYRKEVLNIVVPMASSEAVVKRWLKEYKKTSGEEQAEILSMLARANRNDKFTETYVVPALKSKSKEVRMAAAAEVAYNRSGKFVSPLVEYLLVSSGSDETAAAKLALLQLMETEQLGMLVEKIASAQPVAQAAILQILSEKRAKEYFEVAAKYTDSKDSLVQRTAYEALTDLSDADDTGKLLNLLSKSASTAHVKAVQSALIALLREKNIDKNGQARIREAYQKEKIKLLPVLPYVDDKDALSNVIAVFDTGNDKEKEVAFEALANWQNHEAARMLLAIRKDQKLKEFHERAFSAYVGQVVKSSLPDDQKLLMLREAMAEAVDRKEKVSVISSAGRVRTFLSLMFVSSYLDDQELYAAASRAAMQIALPTSDARPGLAGVEVRNVLQRMLDKLTGQESQYERIDIVTYLEKMPYTKGFAPIFNGKDLTGWQRFGGGSD